MVGGEAHLILDGAHPALCSLGVDQLPDRQRRAVRPGGLHAVRPIMGAGCHFLQPQDGQPGDEGGQSDDLLNQISEGRCG